MIQTKMPGLARPAIGMTKETNVCEVFFSVSQMGRLLNAIVSKCIKIFHVFCFLLIPLIEETNISFHSDNYIIYSFVLN